jgi:hypothetical protein
MPRPGYKSLTINEDTHAQLKHKYEKIRNELKKQGITTFGGYVTSLLESVLEAPDQQND